MAFESYINLFRAAVVRIKGTKLISGVRNRDDDVISSPWLVRLKLTISSFQRCYSMTDNPEKEKVGLGPKQLKMQAFFMRTTDLIEKGGKEIQQAGQSVIEYEGKIYNKVGEGTFTEQELASMKFKKDGKNDVDKDR